MNLENYNHCISDLKNKKRKINLLMGNGFSIAYDKQIFSYNALGTLIQNKNNEVLTSLFSITKNNDFEYIMKELQYFQKLSSLFCSDKKMNDLLEKAQQDLKDALINAVKQMHPDYIFNVPEDKIKFCSNFLKYFINSGGKIFSTNYDLLLYWVMMGSPELHNKAIDGFGREVINYDETIAIDEQELSNLHWGNNMNEQNIFYLHGALHLFDVGSCVEKEEYTGTKYLLENIKSRMHKGHYPLFVTGGTSNDKLESIKHNEYLSNCYKELERITGSLIVFGFKFGDNDEHIIKAINKACKFSEERNGKLYSIYIGCYSEDDVFHIESIADKFKCKIHLFDAKTTSVWNN